MNRLFVLFTLALLFSLTGCGESTAPEIETDAPHGPAALNLEFEKFTLDNGLDVILHVDRSNPVVAIDLAVHVGSGRELPGRTGFAHLFEHLLFLDSENLGYGGLDQMNTRIGGDGTNGFTTNDMTQYFQSVPSDALEKIIWAEADKIGWFINTVSQDVVDNEKQVVKNEKRQRVDNRPYGHNLFIVSKAMYPEGHPYNWTVIGSLADVDAATLQDVKDFYARWYVPNNVTVTIAGDFDPDSARQWIEKYFGEIPRGADIPDYTAASASLEETLKFFHEDNFATVPQLSLTWPTVERFHPDSYALDVLLSYLTEGKEAPLNTVMIDEDRVTTSVDGFHYTKELAGEWYLFINPDEGKDIDTLMPSLQRAFETFDQTGIDESDLNRIKAGIEVGVYSEIQSVLGKAIQLGEYNVFTGDPRFYTTDIERLKAVTTDDVMRVFREFIYKKDYIAVSFVPKGDVELALDGSVEASVVEEQIVAGEGAAPDFDPAARVLEKRTPSAFDRTVEPPFGDRYELPSLEVWRDSTDTGTKLIGVASDETPLVQFSIRFDAGRIRGNTAIPAVPALTAEMLEKGTKRLTTAEFEQAIQALGSTVSVNSGTWTTTIDGLSLDRNLEATLDLVIEMVNTPRWDEEEFALLVASAESDILQANANPNAIAARESAKLRYPADNILHFTSYGPREALGTVTLEDLKQFHANHYDWGKAVVHVVGAYDESVIRTAFADQQANSSDGADLSWPGPQNTVDEAQVFFYDVPGAKQSVLSIERPSLTPADADYLVADAINLQLGGIYTSNLNSTLRVEKGYTYGIRSGFSTGPDRGTFRVRTSVRSNVTAESIQLIGDIVGGYGESMDNDDLEALKIANIRGQALQNETLGDKLRTLSQLTFYGLPDSFPSRQAAAIESLDMETFQKFTNTYLRPDAMRYVVVGDAETQLDSIEELGLGAPQLLNPSEPAE